MTKYTIEARRHTHPHLGEPPVLSALEWLMPEAQLSHSFLAEDGHLHFQVGLESEDHLEAINQLIDVTQRLGYTVINAEVEKWVGLQTRIAVASAFGGGGTAQAKIGNPALSILTAVAAAFAGYWIGSQLGRFEVVYRLVPAASRWTLAPVPPPHGVMAE